MKFKYIEDNHDYLISSHHSRRYDCSMSKNDICLGCADSDVKLPKTIRDHLLKVVNQGDLSYTYFKDEYLKVVNHWFKNYYDVTFEEDQFFTGSGIICLVQVVLETCCHTGDKIIVDIPSYPPFISLLSYKGLILVPNHLIYNEDDGSYQFNFDKFVDYCKDPMVTAYIFCNPHNPTGIVWTEKQLKRIIDICKKYNVIIISDEIWAEVVFNDRKHMPILKADPTATNTVLLHSIGKVFNAGACHVGYGFSNNSCLVARIKYALEATSYCSTTNYLGFQMLKGGFMNDESKLWVKEYCSLLESNKKRFKEVVEAKTKIVVTQGDATNTIWLNYRKLNITPDEFERRLNENIHVFGIAGENFGVKREDCFFRFAVGIFPELLKTLIQRTINEFKDE